MKKPQVRSAGSHTSSVRIVSEGELQVVTGGDGVVNTKLPQLHRNPLDGVTGQRLPQ